MKKWLLSHQETMLADCIALCSIDSTLGEPPYTKDAPFGPGIRKALDCAFGIARRLGMQTLDCDGYVGHAETVGDYPKDAEPFYILTHLDIVPPGDNWTTPPFQPTVRSGNLYARGAIDNKAPTVAALYAAAAANATGKLKRPVRVVFGCDEETTWEGLAHYPHKMNEGFAPDAEFPVIYAEKGVLWLEISWDGRPDPFLTSFQGGERPNMVPDWAEAVTNGVTQTEKGISAHGSTPELGENAARKLAARLHSSTQKNTAAAFLCEILAKAGPDGAGLNIACEDEPSGPLTVNAGKAFLQDGHASVTLDIRYPVTADISNLMSNLRTALSKEAEINFEIKEISHKKPLYVPQDDPLVTTLTTIYNQHTKQNAAPISMGGATYARALTHGVAFGPLPPDCEGTAHQVDEYISLEQFYALAEIYAKAIATICGK